VGPLAILVALEYGDVGFCTGEKLVRVPGEKPMEQDKNQQQTNSRFSSVM